MKLKRSIAYALGLSVALVAPAALNAPVEAAPQGASGQNEGQGQEGRPDRRRGQRGERPDRAAESKVAKVGEPAPEFALKDTAGKEHKLSQYKGKIVVLQWINPQCPVCVRVTSSDVEKNMIAQLKEIDAEVVHLAINSTHFMEPAESAAYLKKHAIAIPALDDRSGTVGKLYNAKRTPHMYVIDGEGVLRYNGAIDNDRAGNKGDERVNYVVNAVRAIKAGETVSPDMTESYGCSVKYNPNAAPAAGDNPTRRGGEGARGGRGGGPEGAEGRRGGRRGAMSEEMLKRFDKDGDGELNEEERKTARETMRAEMLEKYDEDGDGELNDEERQKMREEMRRQRGGGGGGGGGGQRGPIDA